MIDFEEHKMRHLKESCDKKRIVGYFDKKGKTDVICVDCDGVYSIKEGYSFDRGTCEGERCFTDDEEKCRKSLTSDEDEIEYTHEVKEMEKQLMETLNSDGIRKYVWKHFDNYASFEFVDIVVDILDRIDDIENCDDEDVYQAMDDSLLYTEDQWTMMAHYQSPQDANFEDAWESLYSDLLSIVESIKEDRADVEE